MYRYSLKKCGTQYTPLYFFISAGSDITAHAPICNPFAVSREPFDGRPARSSSNYRVLTTAVAQKSSLQLFANFRHDRGTAFDLTDSAHCSC